MGGGTGFCTQGIVRSVPPRNVTLLDQSPDQLRRARGKADLQGITILEVRCAGVVVRRVDGLTAYLLSIVKHQQVHNYWVW